MTGRRKVSESGTKLRYRMMELAASMDDVIPLGRGDPDLDTPAHIVRAAKDAIRRGAAQEMPPPEGLFELRQAIAASPLPGKLGALLMKPTFAGLRKAVDYAEYGGAPLLGVDGAGIVAHGRSSPKAIFSALKAALQVAEADLPKEIRASMAKAQSWLPRAPPRGPRE